MREGMDSQPCKSGQFNPYTQRERERGGGSHEERKILWNTDGFTLMRKAREMRGERKEGEERREEREKVSE